MTHHPDPADLDDLLDGACNEETRIRLTEHLAVCPACAARLAEVEQLVNAARRLPRGIEAPPHLWSTLHRATQAPQVRQIRRRAWHVPAAVAAMLALGAFGVSLLVERPEAGPSTVEPTITALLSPADSALASAEARHQREAPVMLGTLKERAAELNPPTRTQLEQEIQVTREAIAVAKAALEQDSTNQQVKRILAATYDGQLRMLRRVLSEANET